MLSVRRNKRRRLNSSFDGRTAVLREELEKRGRHGPRLMWPCGGMQMQTSHGSVRACRRSGRAAKH